ncbi:MAG TPA: hypothetical protein VGQ53_05410, partial [Chitinophagaceae bacterium]|nr:hypothetical protein [Chitinophagaceae bacterium]
SAQRGFGFDLGLSTSKAPMLAVKYYIDKNAPSIGFSYTLFNDMLGEKKELAFGDTAIGSGWVFYTWDIGYTRVLSDRFSISAEFSFGQKKQYQNIRDDNAPSGGYHRYIDQKSVAGVGGLLLFNINQTFGLFAGYNSIREGTFGLEVRLFKDQEY